MEKKTLQDLLYEFDTLKGGADNFISMNGEPDLSDSESVRRWLDQYKKTKEVGDFLELSGLFEAMAEDFGPVDIVEGHLTDQGLTWATFEIKAKGKRQGNLKRILTNNINKINETLRVLGLELTVVKIPGNE